MTAFGIFQHHKARSCYKVDESRAENSPRMCSKAPLRNRERSNPAVLCAFTARRPTTTNKKTIKTNANNTKKNNSTLNCCLRTYSTRYHIRRGDNTRHVLYMLPPQSIYIHIYIYIYLPRTANNRNYHSSKLTTKHHHHIPDSER